MVQQIDRRKEGWADPRLDGRLEEYTYGRTVGAPAEWSGGKPCRGAAGKRRGGEGRGGEGRRRRGEVASLARKNGGKKGFSTVSCKAMEAAENPPSVTPGHGRPLPMSRGGTALSPGQWISRRRDRHFGRGHGDLHAARRLTRHQIPNHPPLSPYNGLHHLPPRSGFGSTWRLATSSSHQCGGSGSKISTQTLRSGTSVT